MFRFVGRASLTAVFRRGAASTTAARPCQPLAVLALPGERDPALPGSTRRSEGVVTYSVVLKGRGFYVRRGSQVNSDCPPIYFGAQPGGTV